MILFVDRIEKNDLGGFTTDVRKAEYILAVNNLSFEKILGTIAKTTQNPSGAFACGKYIVMFNVAWGLESVNIGLIDYQTDLDKYFDVFADSMSPKSIAAFHQLRERIKLQDQSELFNIELSDNDSDFEIAYRNYIEHRNRQ